MRPGHLGEPSAAEINERSGGENAVTLAEILLSSGGGIIVLLTIIQVTPIKLNPWSALAKCLGRAFNADVLENLAEVKTAQQETRSRLDAHIQIDDERNADERRTRILRFNNELIREIPHTKEEFIDILADIDFYERYCKVHPDYKNNRAVHAIANIGRTYDERLQKHDFL